MIQRKGLKVGDRGTLRDFTETFTLEHLGKKGFYYISCDSSKLVTKDGTKPIDSNDTITYVGNGIWSVSKR